MSSGPAWSQKLRDEIGKAVIGQNAAVERLLVALLAGGHVLLEGMPGLAKTLLVKSLGAAMGVQFERIEFTPDLLPSDVVGTMVFQPKTGEFQPPQGARCSPTWSSRTRSTARRPRCRARSLRRCRRSRLRSAARRIRSPSPFFVMATQNPIEQEGTYPLPEAQTDRFLFKLLVAYPDANEEAAMMQRWGQITQQPTLNAVSSGAELLSLRAEVDRIHVAPVVQNYILTLVRSTRALAETPDASTRRLNFGASPRASLALFQAGRSLAWLRGQDFLSPALIQELAPDVLRHRIGLTYEAEAQEITTDAVIAEVVSTTPVPPV